MLWINKEVCKSTIKELSKKLNISHFLARLLILRDIKNYKMAEDFLNPTIKKLSDPYLVTNIERGAKELSECINKKGKVLIYGDYDVDGITSVVQLVSLVKHYNLNPEYFIPNRLNDGYGLSVESLKRALIDVTPDLIIVVDCGTNSLDSINYLNSLNISIIIIDHHKLKTTKPDNCILINPHVNDLGKEDNPWYNLSASGLVFKFIHGFIKFRRESNDALSYDFKLSKIIDLAAMGILADLVPLNGESRILAQNGLKQMSNNNRMGIVELKRVSKIESSSDCTSSDISFKIGPRINASGRLSNANLPVELLLTNDSLVAKKTSELLESMNEERKIIERKIFNDAVDKMEKKENNHTGYILYGEDWHTGIVGIVASRLTRKYNRPFIVLGNENGYVKGSGRSIKGIDLVKVLSKCNSNLKNWGGHPMAVGISLPKENLKLFEEVFYREINTLYNQEIEEPELEIDGWLSIEDINETLYDEINQLQPFGQNNREPVWGLRNVFMTKKAVTFAKVHKKFYISTSQLNKKSIEVIYWNALSLPIVDEAIDIAFRLESHTWNNKRNIRLVLVDWKHTKDFNNNHEFN